LYLIRTPLIFLKGTPLRFISLKNNILIFHIDKHEHFKHKYKLNITKKYTRNTLKIVCLCYSQSDLNEKRLNAFQF
jgi:hypothetical protein